MSINFKLNLKNTNNINNNAQNNFKSIKVAKKCSKPARTRLNVKSKQTKLDLDNKNSISQDDFNEIVLVNDFNFDNLICDDGNYPKGENKYGIFGTNYKYEEEGNDDPQIYLYIKNNMDNVN